MIEIGEFVDARGSSPFGRWISRLDRHAAAHVATSVYRIEIRNLSNAKGVGVLEYLIGFGPNGNPQARDLFEIIRCLQEREGLHLKVHTVR